MNSLQAPNPFALIDTPRLSLLVCDLALCKAILMGDAHLGTALQARIADGWTEFGPGIFECTLDQIILDPQGMHWWSYLVLLKSPRTLIGSCGFKGRPDRYGEVEIGYEIAPAFRNQGLATETAQGLIRFAAQFPEVKGIKAHTLPNNNASTQVLQKCGLAYVQEMFDPEDGTIWQWKMPLRTTG